MRQLQVQVRWSSAEQVTRVAESHGALWVLVTRAQRPGDAQDWALVSLQLPNRRVGDFVREVGEQLQEAEFVLSTGSAVPLETPLREVQDSISDVSRVSTLELVLSALQSMGSWKGELLLATAASLVATYGILFDVVYLLVGAMLLAPMGSPALAGIVAISVGDRSMLRRATARFAAAVLLHTAVAAALGYAYGLRSSTMTMELITSLSVWTTLVALGAGAAGALAKVQGGRSSMVSESVAGFLVAAALSPPSAVLGLAIPIQRWDYAALMAFLLVLQYLALTLGGWAALTAWGVGPGDASIGRGSRRWRSALVGGVTMLVAGLVLLQLSLGPTFRKADLSRKAVALARQGSEAGAGARLVEVEAHFTRPHHPDRRGESLLLRVTVEKTNPSLPDSAISASVRSNVARQILDNLRDVTPLVDVSVLAPAPAPRP